MPGVGVRFSQIVEGRLFRFLHTVAYAEGLLLVDNLSWRPKETLSDRRALLKHKSGHIAEREISTPVDENLCTESTYKHLQFVFTKRKMFHVFKRETRG